MPRPRTLLRAWLLTALVDFLFASTLSTVFFGSTFARLWQGVASVLIGPEAMEAGTTGVAIGIALHILVALTWATVLLLIVGAVPAVRALLVSPAGALKVALLYGPFVWVVMSFVLIPSMTGRPPAITFRWWVQLAGHVVFVALPMTAVARKDLPRAS